jgi:prepilin-type N-terminal cleavage/methylation domain-containing protein
MYTRRGFTIVELIVVLAIIAILSSVVFGYMMAARKDARDTKRVSHVSQIQLALRLYAEANGAYPSHSSGIVVGEGGSFDTALATFLPETPHDPLGPGDSTYQYIYDSSYVCDGDSHIVLFARTAEVGSTANWADICTGTSDTDAYGVIIN